MLTTARRGNEDLASAEIGRELAKTSVPSGAAHGHQSLVVVAPARDAAPNSLNLHYETGFERVRKISQVAAIAASDYSV
jgi:hypothetical protein